MSGRTGFGAAVAEVAGWGSGEPDDVDFLPCVLEQGADPLRLPPSDAAVTPLRTALGERKSLRTYADLDVPASSLTAVLEAAVRRSTVLGWAVVCRRVAGVPEGTYHVDVHGERLRLQRVGEVPPPGSWPQREFAIAPVVVVAMATLLQPERGSLVPLYHLAGRAAYAATIAAECRGLGSCLFYGPTLAARSSMRFDNVGRAPLIGISLGRQAVHAPDRS